MIHYYHPEWGALRPIRGFLFDMDGLVLDSEVVYCRFWMEAAQSLGFPMTLEQALGMRSLGAALGQKQLEGYFGPTASYHAIRSERIRRMEEYLQEHVMPLKPGVRELLDFLDERGIPAAITSASSPDRIKAFLTPHGIYHRFRAICSARQVAQGKPAPDIYLYGAARLGLDARECLALEDSPTGILAAYRAGCLPVLVPDLDDGSALVERELYAKVDSLGDVMGMIGET